jgi:hypothetical protein
MRGNGSKFNLWVYLKILRKPRENSAMIAGVLAEIGTGHFPNKRSEICRYTNSLLT